MCKLWPLILLFLLYSVALVSAQGSTNRTSSWQTFSGKVHSIFLCLVAEKAEGRRKGVIEKVVVIIVYLFSFWRENGKTSGNCGS